ncbi:retrovirus-related pol polyprotein from transposon TNT 1-94 [Tanacetum coccineum]
MAIRGVLVNGEWVVDPTRVKNEFYQHFSNRFSALVNSGITYMCDFPHVLDHHQVMDLESNVSEDEIRKAVWDCGVDKSPGPDGFMFEFIWKFWDVVQVDIIRAIKCFFDTSKFPKGCNPSFIALILKITDAKLVKDYRLISLIGCQHKIMGKILANRLNFEKAYDSVRWDFLDEIMLKFGFGRGWIMGCLKSSTSSVLVNESPTQEFQFHKGLRQGDPLSPFLFLLIMESLHISFSKAMHQGFFKGIKIGSNDTVCLSHLFYADDAVFIGGVKTKEVSRKETLIGCDIGKTPFKYLGVMAGTSMLKIKAWDMIVDRISVRLSKWKVKTLSVRGRLTLIKSVLGSLPTYYFSLFKVPSGVLKNLESLRSNFFRGNVRGDRKLAWVWRFKTQHDALWVRVVKAIHGFHGSLDRIPPSSKSSTWIECVKGMIQLNNNGVDLMSFVSKRVGDGDKTMFWLDPWLDVSKRTKEGAESSQMEDLHQITHFVHTGRCSKSRIQWIIPARNMEQVIKVKMNTEESSDDQELEAHYMYMAQIQEVTPNPVDNSGPIFDDEPMHKNIKKFQAELDKYNDVNYASKVEIDCSKAKMDLIFAKPEFLKKAQRANPRLYDIGCYNDNLALMLAPEFDETIRLDKESRSKLRDLIRQFDYDQLNNLYELFVPQWEKSLEQHYFPRTSKMSHTSSNNEFSKESFRKQTTLLEKRMDESIPWDQKCKSSKELFKIKKSVDTIFDGVERCKQTIAKRTYFGNIDPFIQNTIEGNFCPQIRRINADLENFHLCLNEEMVADLRYFNSLEHEVDTLKSQLETQKTQFLNEIDRLSREYYYADHMNAILGVYTDLDEVTNLQCDYLETLEKCEHLEKELSKSRTMSKSFEALQKHAINLELDLQQCEKKR